MIGHFGDADSPASKEWIVGYLAGLRCDDPSGSVGRVGSGESTRPVSPSSVAKNSVGRNVVDFWGEIGLASVCFSAAQPNEA